MKVICAWCGKDMGEKDSEGKEDTTHSMCSECFTPFLKDSQLTVLEKKVLGKSPPVEK